MKVSVLQDLVWGHSFLLFLLVNVKHGKNKIYEKLCILFIALKSRGHIKSINYKHWKPHRTLDKKSSNVWFKVNESGDYMPTGMEREVVQTSLGCGLSVQRLIEIWILAFNAPKLGRKKGGRGRWKEGGKEQKEGGREEGREGGKEVLVGSTTVVFF